jgi:AraC-like DNA-binding protein
MQRASRKPRSKAPPTTLSVRYILNLLGAAQARGLSPRILCGQAGVAEPASDAPDLRYRTSEYLSLWKIAMERLRDASFPLDVARHSAPSTSDVLGFSFLTSETFGAGLDRISRHLIVMTDGAKWQVSRSASLARLALVRPDDPVPEHRFADEFALSHIVYWSRRILGVDWEPKRVAFRHSEPYPAEQEPFRALFRCPLDFDQEVSEIQFDETLLALPQPKADSAIAGYFDTLIEAHIERRYPGKAFVRSLKGAIVDGLSRQTCSLRQMAQQLGMSERTLTRRLAEEGVSFIRLLNETRRELAEDHLRSQQLSIGEIAFVLGYAEPTAFHHAFRRWTGMTPAEFRARATLAMRAHPPWPS